MHKSKRHNGSIYLTLGSVFFVILFSFFHRFTLAAQPQHEVIAASPVETTVFTKTILSELNNLGHLIEVQFPALLNAQPQTYRFTLTCDEGGETAFLSWAFDNRCGDSIELIVTPQNPETIPFVSLELQVTPNALFSQLTYTLTIEPLTPLVPLAQSEVNQVIDVYSDRTTTFTSTLSRPTGTNALDLSLRFPNLISFQPQTFRFTLICNDAYASQFELLGINANYGDLLLWENGKHCGDSITETYEPGYLPPIGDLEVQLLPFEFPIFFEYTLIIEPITALLPVALSDANHVINVPVTSATNFSQMISAPLGDQVDRITVRSTALAGGQSWDFAFTLFCIGTGTTGVEWVIADFSETLGCGHTITRHLQGGGAGAPVPSVDMIISLENHADPAHVQYTLIINPAGIQTSAQAPPGFVIALEGVSEFTGTLSSANSSDSINVSVSGLVAGYPRSIEFQLLCSGAGVDSIRASLQGGSSEFGCNESLHHTFDAPGQQLPLVIQQTQPSGNLTYLIAASPIFSPVAPPDPDPHTLVLLLAQASTFSNTISAPEGDSHDTILLDARHPTDQRPRTYTIHLVCEGASNGLIQGLTETGLTFGCGDSFDHTFTADSSPRIPLSLSAREDAGIPVLPAALLTETDPFLLPVHILLPPDAPHTIVNYALFIQPTYLNIPSPDLSQEYITFQVSAPSTQTTTFTQTLTDAQTTHHLNIYFPDLSQAHWQNFTFRLTCAGIGSYAARWYINEVPHSCGSIVQHTMERIASHSGVGISVDVRLDSSENTTFALEYTLHIEPASPYVPIIPESNTVYYLSIELNEPTTFTHQLSSPEGGRSVRVEAAIFPMIGGQAAGRDFTFWLECNGPNAEITTASIEFQNWAYEPLWLLCFMPITQFIDESAGSPPRLYINVAMPDSLLPAFNQFTLHIIPAGEEMPFDSLPPTATPTPFSAVAITLAQPRPTATPTSFNAVAITLAQPRPTATPTSFSAVAITLAQPRPTATPFVIDLATAVIEAPTLRLISPDDGAIFNTQPITLMWTSLANISLYEIDIETCELQSGGCRNEQITTNNNSYTLSLSEDTPRLFIWKVRALLSDGTFTDYSAARTFTFMNTATPTTFGAIAITLAPPRPTATPTSFNAVAITLAQPRPTATPFVIDLATAVIEAPTLRLISPDDGAIFNTQPITLMWTSLANISLYEIDIETCELQSGGCRNEQITTNNNSYTLSLSEDTPRLFTWKVRALLSDGTFTDYSAARTFTFMNTATPTTFGAIAITLAPPTATATPTSFSAVAITLAPPTATATPFIPSFPTATPVSGPGCPGPTAVDNGNALIGMIAGIGAANSNGKPDVINLEAGCTYTVTGPGSPLTINADGGNPLTINGNGATISGGGSVRVFRITSGATLNLNNVTIRDGRNGIDNTGGSVNISGGVITGNSRSFGGGIFNSGTMTIANSTIAGNTATSSGGGVFNIGTMTIINSTITGNTASNNGGGIANASSSIVNDGTVYQVSFGTMTITNSTIARNFAGIGGGLFHTTGPTVLSLQNSIASNNFGGDCVRITHSGPNFGCDGSVQGSALLGDFNGSYIPLLGGSAAIDAGDSSLCPTTDQIGNERNDGNGDGSVVCDLGAIEAQFTNTTIPINAVQPILPIAPQDSSLLTATETSIPFRPSDTPMPIRPSETSIPLRLSDTPIPIRPTNTSIPLRPSDTPIPIQPTNTSIPPRPSDTPIPIRPSDTPAPILPTDLPIAPIDRDFALLVRAGEAASLSDTISFPDGDTSDTISITVEGVGRDPINYTFTLNCTAVGTEFVQWAIMRGRGGLGCGQSITLTFSAEANQQVVQIFLPNNARRSYVNYTLAMTASS